MKKMIFWMLVLFAWTTSLSAQITREQADAIVMEHIQKEVPRPLVYLYANNNTPSGEVFSITTNKEESIKVKYACWVYFLNEYPDVNGPAQRRYFFVKADTGNLLEVITSHDFGPAGDLSAWTEVKASTGIVEQKENNKQIYPNPVNDLLTLPCNGENIRVEIYDLKGACLFSGTLSDKDTCQLNVSFLNAGIYLVNVSGETYRIIKN